MDRYSRGYDERYRGYYDRPRSDTYRPGENYRSERDYRDGGVRGERNYSPNPHYSSGNGRGGGSSGNGNDDRYSYSDSRPYYPPSRGPSPSRSDSRSPRRPSYGYYRSGPSSSYPYNPRRSPSPSSGGRSGSSSRRESYDHRPYHNSPNYPSYPYHRNGSPYPPYSSRRHYSGPPPSFPPASNSGYHSRENSSGPSSLQQQHQPLPPQQRSLHSTPTSTAPNSPGHMNYNNSQVQPLTPATQNQQQSNENINNTIATTTINTTSSIITNNPPPQQPPPPSSLSLNTNYPPSYPYTTPTTSSSSYAGGNTGSNAPIRPHHHSYHHNSHYNNSYQSHHSSPSVTMPPIRQRVSWAPDQEKEVERYHNDQRKLCDEENKILIASRKSRFELELANWDTRKLEHQLELVQKQWDENGMEDLIREELNSRLPGRTNSIHTSTIRTAAITSTNLQIL